MDEELSAEEKFMNIFSTIAYAIAILANLIIIILFIKKKLWRVSNSNVFVIAIVVFDFYLSSFYFFININQLHYTTTSCRAIFLIENFLLLQPQLLAVFIITVEFFRDLKLSTVLMIVSSTIYIMAVVTLKFGYGIELHPNKSSSACMLPTKKMHYSLPTLLLRRIW